MEHSQFRVMYLPKLDVTGAAKWAASGVDMTSCLDFNSQETTEKRMDGSNLPFLKTVFVSGNAITYNSSTRKYVVDKAISTNYKYFTLIDSNENRFVIQSTIGNEIVLCSKLEFNMYATPSTGTFRIELPDFEDDDIFVIFGWKNDCGEYLEPANFTDKIIFVGQVLFRAIKHDNRGTQVLLKLANTTEVLLKTTQRWQFSETEAPTFIDKIQKILNVVNGRNLSKIKLVLEPTPPRPATKVDGSALLTRGLYMDECSAADAIYELCTTIYTGDVVDYYCFVYPTAENLYTLIIRPKVMTSVADLTEGEDFDFLEWSNNQADIISHIVFKCGRDCNNNNITQVVTGSFKKGSRGFRYAQDIAGDILDEETSENRSAFTELPESKYPSSFPYTTAISVRQVEVDAVAAMSSYASFLSHTGTYTVTNKSEFNKFITYLAKARAVISAKAFLEKNNRARDKIKVQFHNLPASVVPGDTSRFVIPTLGWWPDKINRKDYKKKLRLYNKTVEFNSSGCTIIGEYIEDERDLMI